jgi:FMN-dependent NADH-azoreductase
MHKILYVQSSPRAESASTEVARAFLKRYQELHPETVVDELNVWTETLPEFNGDMLAAKYAVIGQKTPTPGQAAAWATVTQMADRLHKADKIVIASPMWNFGVPYKLKHWIDIVTQPGITFGFDPAKGYFGLVKDKKALVVSAHGGEYGAPPTSGMNMQDPYLKQALAFMGVTATEMLNVEKTLYGTEADAASRAAAKVEAERIAATF